MKHLFGTDGIRARMGTYPLTQEGLLIIGKAFGIWAHSKNKPRIIIATDTRTSSSFCKYTLTSGLLSSDITVFDAEILPTPVLHYLIQKYEYDYGIMITASHNSAEYNGIKILTKEGKLQKLDQQTLEDAVTQATELCNYELLGNAFYKKDGFDQYLESLSHNFSSSFLKNQKVVLDCAHGAWSFYAEKIFKYFGAHVITLASSGPNNHINKECGSLYPHQLKEAVLKHQAFVGCAFDGDGDRLIIVNQNGEIKDGDDILAILMHHPRYKKSSAIVISQMSNEGLVEYAQSLNKEAIRACVGDSHILQALQENNLILGGEPSGHIIARDFSESSDALFVALRVIETMLMIHNTHIPTFQKYPQAVINIPVSTKKDLNVTDFQDLLSIQKQLLSKSRIMVRYSGTEPLVRILVEYPDIASYELVTNTIIPSLQAYFI